MGSGQLENLPKDGQDPKEKQISVSGSNRIVVAMNENMCIQCDDEGQIQLWRVDKEEDAQLFKLQFGLGLYAFVNNDSKSFLSRPNSNYQTIVEQSENQTPQCFWKLIPAKAEGYYMIRCNDSELVIGVENAQSKNGANLWLVKPNNSPAQLFKFSKNDD